MALVKFEDYIHPKRGWFKDFMNQKGTVNHRIDGKDILRGDNNGKNN